MHSCSTQWRFQAQMVLLSFCFRSGPVATRGIASVKIPLRPKKPVKLSAEREEQQTISSVTLSIVNV